MLALCAIAVNPWAGSLAAFEEPENGVHPRRLELIAELLVSLATQQDRQVIVTTHSAHFCGAVLKRTRDAPEDVSVMGVRREEGATKASLIEFRDTLFEDHELRGRSRGSRCSTTSGKRCCAGRRTIERA